MAEQMSPFPRETTSLRSAGPTYFAKSHLSMLAASLTYEAPHPHGTMVRKRAASQSTGSRCRPVPAPDVLLHQMASTYARWRARPISR